MKRWISRILIWALLLSAFSVAPASADAIASAKTPLGDASNAKRSNIELAAAAIDGTYVAYGDLFSFNDTVGPRTSECGYRSAVNGRGVKVVGGGVAQVASTLYLALKKLDSIDYEEKKTYGSRFTDSYVSSNKDAIITDYSAGTDFSFYNYYDSFTINMWVSDSYVYCTLDSDSGSSGDVIASSSIYIDGNDAVINNVSLAADSVYDTMLEHNNRFSFNDVVGPRTSDCGYVSAINGRGVKVMGGGVAQVASAIYLAVKGLDDVEIIEKKTYGDRYTQNYVDNKNDAIVTDYNADIDFSFRYTGNATLTIDTYVVSDMLYCEIRQSN